jgi:hypothetical protein
MEPEVSFERGFSVAFERVSTVSKFYCVQAFERVSTVSKPSRSRGSKGAACPFLRKERCIRLSPY